MIEQLSHLYDNDGISDQAKISQKTKDLLLCRNFVVIDNDDNVFVY